MSIIRRLVRCISLLLSLVLMTQPIPRTGRLQCS
ncbi:BgTH12-04923 [Blumeria graminis f. sp. triticale]|uniref:BgTH12-04923 n=1 Tax=Blumeria graminis f. sp. triticale TaxID=1689686 RepID=A0A9W4D0H5_BLUGR|nr:BgTH12-04923 [Blumeria graminis f. sp. triticale]